MTHSLERESHPELDLTTRRCGFCDRSKLWSVYKSVRRSKIRVIESVESLGTYLELDLLGNRKLSLQREIESLPARTINCVSSYVTESEGGRRCKCSRVKPLIGGSRAGSENRQASVVSANRIFTEQRSCVRRIAKDRNS